MLPPVPVTVAAAAAAAVVVLLLWLLSPVLSWLHRFLIAAAEAEAATVGATIIEKRVQSLRTTYLARPGLRSPDVPTKEEFERKGRKGKRRDSNTKQERNEGREREVKENGDE